MMDRDDAAIRNTREWGTDFPVRAGDTADLVARPAAKIRERLAATLHARPRDHASLGSAARGNPRDSRRHRNRDAGQARHTTDTEHGIHGHRT